MGIRTNRLMVRFQVDPPGVLETTARPDPRIVIHFGAPVDIKCERGGTTHRGDAIHGDVDIIPAGMASQWTLGARDSALVIDISQEHLLELAAGMAIEPSETALLNRFKVRDTKLEHLAWALKEEMDEGFPSGQLYIDSIGSAMASHLLCRHSIGATRGVKVQAGGMAAFRLRRVLSFIEGNLNGDLPLSAIAALSGLSISHCQRAFCRFMGVSIHQYVLRRRVERAKNLLANTKLTVSDVAIAAGFAHQSHMALQMRRLLGVSPGEFRNELDLRDEQS